MIIKTYIFKIAKKKKIGVEKIYDEVIFFRNDNRKAFII